MEQYIIYLLVSLGCLILAGSLTYALVMNVFSGFITENQWILFVFYFINWILQIACIISFVAFIIELFKYLGVV